MWWAELLNNLVAQLGVGAGAAASSFESIATVTAAGGETALTFSSIPSTYKHLQIRGIARVNRALAGTDNLFVTFNGDSGANYSYHNLEGNGASATAAGGSAATSISIQNVGVVMNSSTSGIFAANIFDIHDYASTSKNKTLRAFAGANGNTADTAFLMGLLSGAWYNTAAITSVTMTNSFGFIAGSTFALYGVK